MATQTVISLKLDPGMKERIQKIADERKLAPDAVALEAIEEYVDRQEKLTPFDRHTLAAIAEFESTGLHLTEEEVDEWVARLEAGEDVDPPECHT